MFRQYRHFCLISLVCIAAVINGEKEACDLFENDCIFKAANILYPKMIAGIPGVEPSDPLHKKEISVPLPRFSYKLHNATMTGLKGFTLNYINFYPNGTFIYGIVLPVTKIEAYYELHGQLGDMILNGKGACKLTYYEHSIHFDGKYFASKDIVDKKLHNFIKDFIFTSEVKGDGTYEYENLTNQDKGPQGMCNLKDDDCVTKAIRAGYPKMIAGMPGVETSDPIHKEEIAVNLPQFSYKLHNASMTGFNNMSVTYAKFFDGGTVTFGMLFPVIKVAGNYEIHGQLGDMILNGKGPCQLMYYDHNIDFIGKYFTSRDRVDKKIHNFLSDFIFELREKGDKDIEYNSLTNNEEDLSENELKQLDEAVQRHVITEFLQKHIEYADDYLRIVPVADIFKKQN